MSPRSRLRLGLLLALVLVNAVSFPAALGQGGAQTPAAQQQREEVLRINTELVQTDVLVLDKSGKAVPGLTRDQFELLVDGQPVPIQFFESVEAGGAREASKIAAARGGSAASAAASRLLAETGRTFIFYIDDLHLSQSSVQRTRQLLNKFIDGMASGDQMLIISPSGQIGFLQQLTDNKAVLKMAASRVTYQAQSVASSGRRAMTVFEARAIDRGQKDVIDYKTKEYIDDMGIERAQKDVSVNAPGPGTFPPPDPAIGSGAGIGGMTGGARQAPQGAGAGRSNPVASNMGVESADYGGGANMVNRRHTAEQAVKSEARRVLMQANNVNSALLSSLESLTRGSGSVPGRKLIFFVSDGFVLDTKNNDTAERLRRVVDAAARAGAVFYTLDSKGLSVDFADAGKDSFSDIFELAGNPNAAIDNTSLVIQESTAAKEVLRTLSAETGGRAILNRNDLEGGVGQVVRETGSYYLLAWRPQPEAAAGQPKFKTIKVAVKGRPELRVLARGGFYTQPPPPLEADAKTAVASSSGPAATKAAEADLRTAVTAAFPRGQLAVAAYTAVVNEGGSYKATGLADLSGYQAADGKGDVDFVAVVLDSSGKSVSSVAQNVKPPSDEGGAKPFRITAKMPNALAPGLYQMRIAARDARTGRVGSVFQWLEIPEFKPGKMTLSSMFLTEETGQGGGTLEVERRFARASNLLLQFYVYNAARSAAGQPDVTVALNILQGGKVVVGAPAAPLPAAGDPARIQYSVSFPLGEFPPGNYALQVVVEDRVAKSAVTQQVGFTVE